MKNMNEYGPTVLRLVLGLLFIIPGIDKLIGTLGGGHAIAGLLGTGLTWVLLLVEIIFGLAVLLGYKLKYTVWPLIAVLVVATILVHLPSDEPMKVINILFHLLGVAALLSVSWTGAGKYAVKG